MKYSGIEGCCVARNIFDLGGAHGVRTHNDVHSFFEDLRNKLASVNIALTNSNQRTTRDYLKQCGFVEVEFPPGVGHHTVKVHVGYHSVIMASKPAQEYTRKLREVEKKRREERQKMMEKERRRREEANKKFLGRLDPKITKKLLSKEQINKFLGRAQLDRHATGEAIGPVFRRLTGINYRFTNTSLYHYFERDKLIERIHQAQIRQLQAEQNKQKTVKLGA